MTTTMTTKKNSFDRFGDDLAELLLQYLPIDNKWRLQSVSKQWSALIFNRQTSITLDTDLCISIGLQLLSDRYQRVKLFAAIIEKCPNIERVVISDNIGIFGQLVSLLAIHCPHIKHIDIYYSNDRNNWRLFEPAFDRFLVKFGQQLQTLELMTHIANHRLVVNKVKDYLPQLKKLVLKDNSISLIVFSHFIAAEDNCLLPTTIQSLSFSLTDNYRSQFRRFAANYGHRLIELDINVHFDSDIDVKSFVRSLSQISQLRRLRLTVSDSLSTKLISELIDQQFCRQCPQLSRLSLVFSGNSITDTLFNQLMDTLGKNLKQLKQLDIDCEVCYNNDSDISADNNNNNAKLTSDSLKHMKQLTHLILSLGGEVCGDQFFHDIYRHLPRLQLIHIDEPIITRRSLQSLTRLRRLQTVHLIGCLNPVIADHYIIDDLISGHPMVTNVNISFANTFDKFIYRSNNDLSKVTFY